MWLVDASEYYAPSGAKYVTYQNTVLQYVEALSKQVRRGQQGKGHSRQEPVERGSSDNTPSPHMLAYPSLWMPLAAHARLVPCPLQLHPETGMPLFYRQIVGMSYQLAIFRWGTLV